MSDAITELGGPDRDFPRTSAELQAALRRPGPAAMESLARRYWKPVYHFLRLSFRKSNEEAKDLAQAFFLWLLERELLLKWDPSRSTFRTYLKGLLRNFAGNEHQAMGRLKRGGGARMLSLDALAAEAESETDPERAFDRQWKRDVVERAVERVRSSCQARGRIVPFLVFQLHDLDGAGGYAEVAARLGLKEGDVRNHLHEIRRAVRDAARAELE